ncbi:MAG: phosphate/phosphite/phosphonate ABC transporter substrate-binding protein [Pseudomonadota bacterium]
MRRRTFLGWSGALAGSLATALVGCGRGKEADGGPAYMAEPPSGAAGDVRYLAIHPLHNPLKLFEFYAPLVDYLNRRIPGLGLELEASNNYAHYETKIRDRTPAFLLPNPYQALMALDLGYNVIAEAGDSDDFRGVFIVRKDSPLAHPSDLKGKRAAYPAPTALAAAMMPQYWLVEQGLKLQSLDNRYVGSQESAILNALHREADIAVTWPPPWRAFQRDHPEDAAQLRLIWQTPPLINNAFMARDDMPEPLVTRLRALLLRLHEDPEGAALLWKMETHRFYPADNARYRNAVGGFLTAYQDRVGPLP